MKPMRIEEEWEVGALRVRLMVCDGDGQACVNAVRVLVGERDNPETDWLVAAYIPREDQAYDAEVRRDLEDEHVTDTLLHGIALFGARWPLDCGTADETAKALDRAPAWMMNVPTEEVRAIRRWCWGLDWMKVPAALRELRYCTWPCDRPVKKGLLRP